jgi:pilus assembly protein CpaF
MGLVNLTDEIYRRQNNLAPGRKEAPMSNGGGDWETLFQVIQEILHDYSDVVHAVSTGAKDWAVLERLVAQIITEHGYVLQGGREATIKNVLDNILRYGVLQRLIDDPQVTDIFVNGPRNVYKRVNNQDIFCPEIHFRDHRHLEQYIRTVLAKVGQRITQAECLVDTRDTRNHIRINAGIPPAAKTPYLCIRKHTVINFTAEDFRRAGTFNREVQEFIALAMRARLNTVIAGPTGSGKTTLMRFIASQYIPGDERIVVMEEEEELRIIHRNQVALEAKKKAGEDDQEITLDDLVRNGLRMAMRRMLLGEFRSKEAFALIRAFGTGHDGGLVTVHANDLYNTIDQIAVMMLYANAPLNYEHLKLLIAQALNLIIYMENYRITDIAYVAGYDHLRQEVLLEPILETERDAGGNLVYIWHPLSDSARKLFWRRGVVVQ